MGENPSCGKRQTGRMTDSAGTSAGNRLLPTLPFPVGGSTPIGITLEPRFSVTTNGFPHLQFFSVRSHPAASWKLEFNQAAYRLRMHCFIRCLVYSGLALKDRACVAVAHGERQTRV